MHQSDAEGLRIIRLREYGTTAEPVALSAECAATIAGHLDTYLKIVSAWGAEGRYTLTANSFVGDIIIGDVHIRISSAKASTANLFWMLTYAKKEPTFRDALSDYAQDEGLFEYLVTVFARRVEDLARGGLHRDYRLHQGVLPRMRGRLDLPRQLRQAAIHPERFALQWSEHTQDTLENRLLKGVLHRLAIMRFPNRRMLGHRLRRILSTLDLVSLVPITDHGFASVRLNRLNVDYKLPLALGHLLWRHLHVRNEGGHVPFLTFLIDLNSLFEDFVTAYLQDRLDGEDLTVSPQHQMHLDRDGLETATVDVLLHHQTRTALPIDTKYKYYKTGPGRDDLNQMFGYCHALGVPRGILLYPHDRHLRDVRYMSGATIEAWGIDLGGDVEALRKRMDAMAEELVML